MPAGVWVVAAVALVVALGFDTVVPAIALFASDFGVGRTAVGLAVSAFAFCRFVTSPFGGRLVARFGERDVLVAGCLVVALTSGAAGFAPSFGVFVLLLRLAPPVAWGRATATFQGGFLLGGVVGRMLTHPVFLVALVANLGVGRMLFGVRNSLLTLYVVDLGGTATVAGVVLLLGALAQGVALRFAGGLADRRGRRPAIVLARGCRPRSSACWPSRSPGPPRSSWSAPPWRASGPGPRSWPAPPAPWSATSAGPAPGWRCSRWPATSARSADRSPPGPWPTAAATRLPSG